MINLILQYPLFYRLYQKTVRKKNHEYDLFKFIFSEIHKKNQIRMLDLCSGDSFVLKYVGEYLTDYIGVDNNEKYLKNLKSEWPDFKFINTDISKLDELREIKNFEPNLIFMNGAIHHLNDKTMKSINDFNYKFKNSMFLSVDPVKHNNGLINKIMPTYKQFIIDDFYQMSFQNIFHFNNINIPELYNNWKNIIK